MKYHHHSYPDDGYSLVKTSKYNFQYMFFPLPVKSPVLCS